MTGFSPAVMVSTAKHFADIGYHEGPNNANLFSQWQYGNADNPWCDSFVCYCAWTAGFRFPSYSACGEKGDYNVGSHHQHAIAEGVWRDRSYVASPGDLVVLSFDLPDQHIEMVLDDQGAPSLATIGGNTGDAVRYRNRNRANVVGFIALTQAGQNRPPSVPVVVVGQKSQGDTMPTLIPARARVINGRTPEFTLDVESDHIFAYNGAKLHWRGPATTDPSQIPAALGSFLVYKIPTRGPHYGIIETQVPYKLSNGKEIFVPSNVLCVTASDGGCAFADIYVPAPL